ncbi:MAG TPA: Xaa-Pro aminopeptidase [Candidatus Saccharimonadales bacterium]|nr:Xaa-Pro aminopeptidase [Candidatus Saccharimonadales bacterium]
MQTLFTSQFFITNRQKLQKALPDDALVVIAAHGLLQQSADTTYPFRQDSNFAYLTGLNLPDLVLVMDAAETYVIVPGRSSSREAFDGTIDKKMLAATSGVAQIVDDDSGWERLGAQLKKHGAVHTLQAPAPYIEHYGLYTNPARARLVERLKTWQPDARIVDIREHLVAARMVKQPEELQAIRQAIAVTEDGIRKVTQSGRLETFKNEYEIENELTRAFRTDVAGGHAFSPIVASGARAVTLHNVENTGALASGELIVIDVGAQVHNYAADITRTVAYGRSSQRQQDVYQAVLDVQAYALGLLKPGTLLKDYEDQVAGYLGTQLQSLGLIQSSDAGSIRAYYPHAASHFLGLDVHDVGDYARPLEPGMVLTCEPGIYIPEEGIGVRIEDDILITATGHELLSEALPRRLSA